MKTYYIQRDNEGNIKSVYSRPQKELTLEEVDSENAELQSKFDSEVAEIERSRLIQARANEILKNQAEAELVDEGVIERVISR